MLDAWASFPSRLGPRSSELFAPVSAPAALDPGFVGCAGSWRSRPQLRPVRSAAGLILLPQDSARRRSAPLPTTKPGSSAARRRRRAGALPPTQRPALGRLKTLGRFAVGGAPRLAIANGVATIRKLAAFCPKDASYARIALVCRTVSTDRLLFQKILATMVDRITSEILRFAILTA